MTLVLALLTMGGLGFIFAAGLAIADKKLRVEEDPKITQIADVLPGVNCGACGYAGCNDFAVNVVEGEASVTGCPVGGNETAREVATIMGVQAGATTKEIPRVMCHGGNAESVQKMVNYYGPLSCAAMDIVSGGEKQCMYGCLGAGDCVEACPFDALVMNHNGIPEVVPELCTGCTICVSACPRDVIQMHPIDREVFVFCNNHDDAKAAKEVCTVACLACGICAKKSGGAIEIIDNVGRVSDYGLLNPDDIPFEKCKTGAIQRLDVSDLVAQFKEESEEA